MSAETRPAATLTPGTTLAAARDARLDVFRGLAICAVLLLHVSGHFLPALTSGSPGWYALAIFNRLLVWAVPAFLLLSAYLGAASLLRAGDKGGNEAGLIPYVRRRLGGTLWPYLLWSGVYLVFASRQTLLGGGGNGAGRSVAAIAGRLVWGKAYYHLYFLVVLLQLQVALPLLAAFVRRVRRPNVVAFVLFALLLQAAVYAANARWAPFPFVGSVLLWYVPPVALGLWLAAQARAKPAAALTTAGPGIALAAVAALAGLALYGPVALQTLGGGSGRDLSAAGALRFQAGNWLYTTGAAFLLLVLAGGLIRRAGQRPGLLRHLTNSLATGGVYSFPVYLLHPLVIYFLDRGLRPVENFPVGAALPIYAVCTLLIPLLIARAVEAAAPPWVAAVLWGRRPAAPLTAAAATRTAFAPAMVVGVVLLAGLIGLNVWSGGGARGGAATVTLASDAVFAVLPPGSSGGGDNDVRALLLFRNRLFAATRKNGLILYAGPNAPVPWRRVGAPVLSSNAPRQLLKWGRTLYVRHASGQVDTTSDGENWTRDVFAAPTGGAPVTALAFDGRRLFVARPGGWSEWNGGAAGPGAWNERYRALPGLQGRVIETLYPDGRGHVWAAVSGDARVAEVVRATGQVRWHSAPAAAATLPGRATVITRLGEAILVGRASTAGKSGTGENSGGLARRVDAAWTTEPALAGQNVSALARTDTGGLLVATTSRGVAGLWHAPGPAASAFGPLGSRDPVVAGALRGSVVQALLPLPDGLWVGTNNGLVFLREPVERASDEPFPAAQPTGR